jgi:hypothetical protein
MKVHILHPPDVFGRRREDDVDESELICLETVIDNEDERAEMIEYCFKGCRGMAHRTGVPDAPSHFCNAHVHRSAHVTKKKWPDGMTGGLGSFT